ncbi:hypothetical protein ES703_67118 [subsurface metagenome]
MLSLADMAFTPSTAKYSLVSAVLSESMPAIFMETSKVPVRFLSSKCGSSQ